MSDDEGDIWAQRVKNLSHFHSNVAGSDNNRISENLKSSKSEYKLLTSSV